MSEYCKQKILQAEKKCRLDNIFDPLYGISYNLSNCIIKKYEAYLCNKYDN
jgi:hypothetical protein